MSTKARKERKRAGIKFVHPVKEGTPMEARRGVLEGKRAERRKRQRKIMANMPMPRVKNIVARNRKDTTQ